MFGLQRARLTDKTPELLNRTQRAKDYYIHQVLVNILGSSLIYAGECYALECSWTCLVGRPTRS